jgi:hypothetical protein
MVLPLHVDKIWMPLETKASKTLQLIQIKCLQYGLNGTSQVTMDKLNEELQLQVDSWTMPQ